jgi:hypothetical protein
MVSVSNLVDSATIPLHLMFSRLQPSTTTGLAIYEGLAVRTTDLDLLQTMFAFADSPYNTLLSAPL